MSGTVAISTTSRRELLSFFFLQGKAPNEIHTILTETLACFLPGPAKDLSAPLYIQEATGSYPGPETSYSEVLFVAFLRPCRKMPRQYLNSGQTHYCHVLSNSIFTNYPLMTANLNKGKGRIQPRRVHERPEGEYRYGCSISLTSALEWNWCLMSRPGRFPPEKKEPVPVVQEAGWSPKTVWMGAKNLAHNWIRSPVHRVHRELLYRLLYHLTHN